MDKLRLAAEMAINAIEEMEHNRNEDHDKGIGPDDYLCPCSSFDWQDIARALKEGLGEKKPDPMGEALNSGSGVYKP